MKDRIAVLGAGSIGGAIAKSLLKSGYKGTITAADVMEEKVKEMTALGISATSDNRKAAAEADILFICVKPGDVALLLKQLAKDIAGKLVISSAATLPLAFLKKTVPEAKFVRMMPNLAILVQASYTAFCCDADVMAKDKQKVQELLGLMGTCEEIDEKYMDAITGLSGSGPGYLSIIVEAMTYAGLKLGLPRNIAQSASAQTMLGTGKLVLELNEHPAKIRDMVTTPGGTTIEAIYQLEGSQVRQALIRAIEEAARKSQLIREKLTANPQ
ncbi:MAG: pyrroline-5-carboxylate reductase [Candidatus Bathyarchaeia archaeon]